MDVALNDAVGSSGRGRCTDGSCLSGRCVIALLVQDPNGIAADTGRSRVASGRST